MQEKDQFSLWNEVESILSGSQIPSAKDMSVDEAQRFNGNLRSIVATSQLHYAYWAGLTKQGMPEEIARTMVLILAESQFRQIFSSAPASDDCQCPACRARRGEDQE